ncbi:FeoB-associated Cys-rich membrane protein [Roseivirga seohaensis]|uniref:FeoB-associated Cys-rich membrane protein n=1 Tax=Roseivirga seohaensis TaxID=1914963 RepID=UPI0009E7A527|nr:FeoB-associated Cys-rich membrane protein [Roseivirga seohaensis]|tara:strand:- start:2048 stop:2221 length:174 start_codon:yes stop_codon:yes gene_type:complete
MQEVIVGIVFLVALIFIGRHFYNQYKSESGCPKGCGSCDISKEVKKMDFKMPEHLKN